MSHTESQDKTAKNQNKMLDIKSKWSFLRDPNRLYFQCTSLLCS